MFLRPSMLHTNTLVSLIRRCGVAAAHTPWAPSASASPMLPWVAPCSFAASISTTTLTASGGLKSQSGTAIRFYKEASVVALPDEGGYGIALDGRMVKTPARKVLVAPTRALATAIAAEWEFQDAKLVRPFTMPLMALSSTAIDMPRASSHTIETLLRLTLTDSMCVRYEDGPVAEKQEEVFDPILLWIEKKFKAPVRVSTSFHGTPQLDALMHGIQRYLEHLDSWHLTAVESLSAACKSVMMGVAIAEGQLEVREAIRALRLEEDTQMAKWGLVEGGHDIDIADINVRIAAPVVFLKLLKLP